MHAHSTIQLGMCALVLAFDVEVCIKPHAQRQSQTKIQVPLQLIAGNCTAINYTYQN